VVFEPTSFASGSGNLRARLAGEYDHLGTRTAVRRCTGIGRPTMVRSESATPPGRRPTMVCRNPRPRRARPDDGLVGIATASADDRVITTVLSSPAGGDVGAAGFSSGLPSASGRRTSTMVFSDRTVVRQTDLLDAVSAAP